MPLTEHEALLLQISKLRLEKKVQGQELQRAWNTFGNRMSPGAVGKDSLHRLTHEPEIKADLGSAAVHAGDSRIIGKVLGKHRSIKGYIASVVVEKLSFSFLGSPS